MKTGRCLKLRPLQQRPASVFVEEARVARRRQHESCGEEDQAVPPAVPRAAPLTVSDAEEAAVAHPTRPLTPLGDASAAAGS